MSSLSGTPFGQAWLKNFDEDDRPSAKQLLDKLLLVSASEFSLKISQQLTANVDRAMEANEVLALYAEREMPAVNGDALPFFAGTETGRATGHGIQPVEVSPKLQDVGSEGIIAALIYKFCKANPGIALSHPGPDVLRSKRVRKIIIVADFIGSGQRVSIMLEAFAKVASIQSWRSYGLIDFEVVCYSGTEHGLAAVKSHRLKPKITIHVSCPVVHEAFKGAQLASIGQLCAKYPKGSKWPLGFKATGSLIAFSHGIPNNAPQIFHSSFNGWQPLFRGRSTQMSDLDQIADTSDHIVEQSTMLLGVRNARQILKKPTGELWTHTMLVLHVAKGGMQSVERLSARTRLSITRVEEILEIATTAGWLSPTFRLTRLGRNELRWQPARKLSRQLAFQADGLYFPNQLRAP